jgi:uncharacterized membrane protein YhaH (DUF805 family)
MSFAASIRTVLRRYAEFEGRSGRAEFWWGALFNVLVLAAIDVATGGGGDNPTEGLGRALAGVWSIAVLLPNLGVTVRRLRDAGYRWTHVFWLLVPVAGVVVLATFLARPTKDAPPDPVSTPAPA